MDIPMEVIMPLGPFMSALFVSSVCAKQEKKKFCFSERQFSFGSGTLWFFSIAILAKLSPNLPLLILNSSNGQKET
jgi:Na+-transporting NADH:ubiquinone oxidoreductase subunit NqrE